MLKMDWSTIGNHAWVADTLKDYHSQLERELYRVFKQIKADQPIKAEPPIKKEPKACCNWMQCRFNDDTFFIEEATKHLCMHMHPGSIDECPKCKTRWG